MTHPDDKALIAQIIASYLSNNTVAVSEIPSVIESITRAFCGPAATALVPAHQAPEDYAVLRQNVKYFGYQLALKLAADLPVRMGLKKNHIGLKWKPSTQEDLESDWVAYWLGELKLPVILHRKLWEYGYVLQAIYEHGHLRPGARGLGFGCGEEPIASYLASHGIDILVTDLETESAKSLGWLETNEHSSSLNSAYKENLIGRDVFEKHVQHRFVDMTDIASDLVDFDFNWSICALEHLGSIRRGLDFIINSMKTLRSGGIAVHTTEFNFNNDENTLDNNTGCVLFQKRHFLQLADEMTALGYEVAPIDFFVGGKPLDSFVDIPPYGSHWPDGANPGESIGTAHIKTVIGGYASTCFGIVARAP